MCLVKIDARNYEKVWINVEDISFFYYNKKTSETRISLKSGEIIAVPDDKTSMLTKIITTQTNGSVSGV